MPILTDYVEKWGLENPRQFAMTGTSTLYRVNRGEQQLVLKLFTPVGMVDEINSAIALQCFDGKSAVRIFDSDETGQLIEYADGKDLKSLVTGGEDERATVIISEVLNNLHGAYKGPIPEALTSLKTRFRSLFEKAQSDKEKYETSLYTKAAEIADNLLSAQQDQRVLHGDMHHDNVIHSAERGWLAIDPKGLHGERTFDAANTLCNPQGMNDLVTNETRFIKTAELLADNMNLDINRLFAFTFAYACLSASWSIEDGLEPKLALEVAAMAEQHCSL